MDPGLRRIFLDLIYITMSVFRKLNNGKGFMRFDKDDIGGYQRKPLSRSRRTSEWDARVEYSACIRELFRRRSEIPVGEASRRVLIKLLCQDPRSTNIRNMLGDLESERGNSEKAKHWYQTSLKILPGNRPAKAGLLKLAEAERKATAAVPSEDAFPSLKRA